uniref:Uncharacterized protein n=1 Tax=Nelumbo nucifera TaxID=4432 RepID=A0A822XST3_NELNU|nr:TPA_asm: hypothetical protein HUJ06_024860 [Nelumbo nucifera]
MECIIYSYLPTLSHIKHRQTTPTRLFGLPINETTKLPQGKFLVSTPPLRTQAFTTSSVVLGFNSSSADSPGDFSVLIQTRYQASGIVSLINLHFISINC